MSARRRMGVNTNNKSTKLAILIDADNANPNLIELLLREIAKYGTANVKRIYGDWTKNQLNCWKEKLNKLAIQPIQQFNYTTGKNATDSALIIDAMDLLYTENFDGFCIVSSDSDFTRLASRIREDGLVVYGFGEQKTPESFVVACDKFIYTEILEEPEDEEINLSTNRLVDDKKADESKILQKNKQLVKLLKNAYQAIAGEDGWASLGTLGAQLTKLSPSFDTRNYGYSKLGNLMRTVGLFEVRETPHKNNPLARELHIKLKSAR
ncbi:NYN domain-containing protein [Lyngbya aestuarii]|uniref:NYN domain-containing protein n=1 Tax=Lyngbya aestuarii TaxID=118322 RepID=UPI00403DE661